MVDMTEGNPNKLILKFAFPMILGNIFQQVYNLVDSIVVGKFVGGAVLTEEYAKNIGADYYSKDAKSAIEIAQMRFKI